MELAVVIALAETFGAALYKEARIVFVLDFIADNVRCRSETGFDVSAVA